MAQPSSLPASATGPVQWNRGTFSFTASGVTTTVWLQRSADLVNWKTIGTNQPVTSLVFADCEATNKAGFYRIIAAVALK
jgi:hypothetical protein